ncbi:hypothetical protein KEM55_002966 [Ascosphaera atra]|nr:hypothetical protein KEM55_002966 [Ascosphaera atra]
MKHEPPQLPKPRSSVDANGSPTKGILMTPGTTSKFPKTVSFGEQVVDMDSKRRLFGGVGEKGSQKGNGQENLAPSDEKRQPKQRQPSLNEAAPGKTLGIHRQPEESQEKESAFGFQVPSDDEDVTVDLELPHSQSGLFWKQEYESYRQKTALETLKLVEYRRAAKRYAKQKEEETQWFIQRLREKEATNSDLERQLYDAQMMVVEKEDEKHKKWLEEQDKRHKEDQEKLRQKDNELAAMAEKLREAEEALRTKEPQEPTDDANGHVQALQSLAEDSERKAKELARENSSLKHMLARLKSEVSNYEGRRRAKEEKLKLRESKLQTRVQRYKERIEEMKREHEARENEMQRQTDSLRRKLSVMGISTGLISTQEIDRSLRDHGGEEGTQRSRSNNPSRDHEDDELRHRESSENAQQFERQLPRRHSSDEDEEYRQQDPLGETPKPARTLSRQNAPNDVGATPLPSMAHRRANPGRFARSPAASLASHGPASAKKASMSSQRVYAAQARLKMRGRQLQS